MNDQRATGRPIDSPAAPPVDLAAFRFQMRELGIEEIVEATIGIFRNESPGRIAELFSGLARGEAGEIRCLAHALRSAAAAIHARRLADLLLGIETYARARDVPGAKRLGLEVSREFERVMATLSS